MLDHPLQASLVRIRRPDGRVEGGGFLVAGGLICTASHVIAEAMSAEGEVGVDFPFFNFSSARAKVEKTVKKDDGDIALLRLTTAVPEGAEAAPLFKLRRYAGAAVKLYGFPQGHDEGVPTSALIGDSLPGRGGRMLMERDKNAGYRIEQGFSGTPVWYEAGGGVVGMVVDFERNEKARTSVMVSLDTIHGMFPEIGELRDETTDLRMDQQRQFDTFKILDNRVKVATHYQVLPFLHEVERQVQRFGPVDLEGSQRWEEEKLYHEDASYQPLTAEQSFAKFPRIVVLGPPGSGKSALLDYLVWKAAQRSLDIRGGKPPAIRIRFREWKIWSEKSGDTSLIDYILEIYKDVPRTPNREEWLSLLTRGNVLLLLDGLDEISRDPHFDDLILKALANFKDCPTILTSRTVSFEQYRPLCAGFTALSIGGLTKDQIENFVRVFPGTSKTYSPEAVLAMLEDAQLGLWATNPLLLSIICYTADTVGPGRLPLTRSALYRTTLDKLLTESARVAVRYPGGQAEPSAARKIRILQRAVLRLFLEANDEMQLFHTEEKILRAFTEACEQEGLSSNGVAEALLEDLTKNSGLLRASPGHGYFFLHPTFQEYLTASGLAQVANEKGFSAPLKRAGRQTTLIQLIESLAWEPRWQEVLIFLAAQLSDPGPLLRLLTDSRRDDLFRHFLSLSALCLSEVPNARPAAMVDEVTSSILSRWYRYWNWDAPQLVSHWGEALRSLFRMDGRVQGIRLSNYVCLLLGHPSDQVARVRAAELVGQLGATAARDGSVREALIQALEHNDEETRLTVLMRTFTNTRDASVFGYPEIADRVKRALRDEKSLMRLAALRALVCIASSRMDPQGVISASLQALRDSDSTVTLVAAHGFQYLWRRPTYQELVVPALLGLAKERGNPRLQADIMWAFFAMGAEVVRQTRGTIVAVLVENRGSTDTTMDNPGVRAAHALSLLNRELADYPEIVASLCRAFREGALEVQREVAWTLARGEERLGAEGEVGRVLWEAFESPQAALRAAASFALEKTRAITSRAESERVREELMAGLAAQKQFRKVDLALSALRLSPSAEQHQRIVEVLVESLTSDEESTREEAVNACRSLAEATELLGATCEVLVGIFQAGKPTLTKGAGKALAIIAETQGSNPKVQHALDAALGAGEMNARFEASLAMQEMGLKPEEISEVLSWLRSFIFRKEANSRMAAMSWISRTGLGAEPGICDALVHSLGDADREVRTRAANTLAELMGKGIRIFPRRDGTVEWTTTKELARRSSESFEAPEGTRLRNDDGTADSENGEPIGEFQTDFRELHHKVATAFAQLGRLDEAMEAYQRILEFDSEDARGHLALSLILAEKGEIEGAVLEYCRATALDAELSEGPHTLAETLEKKGALDGAAAAFRIVIRGRSWRAEGHFGLGTVLARKGQLQEAIGEYRKAIKWRPRLWGAYYGLISAFSTKGDIEEVKATFNAMFALRPEHTVGHVELATLLAEKGRLEEAAAEYRAALALEQNALAHFGLGSVLTRQHQLEAALAEYQMVISLSKDMWEAHYNLARILVDLGRRKEAIEAFRKVIELQPDYFDARFGLATALYDERNFSEAAVIFAEAVKLNPQHAGAHFSLGTVFAEQGNFESAIGEYQAAIDCGDDSLAAYHNLAGLLARTGKLQESIAAYGKAIEIDPRSEASHCGLGIVLLQSGSIDEAIVEIREAIALKPDFSEAYLNLGLAFAQKQTPSHVEEAAAAYRKAIELRPESVAAHFGLATILASQGKIDEAILEYSKSDELQPDTAQILLRWADLLTLQRRFEDAIDKYNKTLALTPGNIEAHSGRGFAFLQTGRFEEMVPDYQAVIEKHPDNFQARLSLGTALIQTGHANEAEAEFRAAVRLNPEHGGGHYGLATALAQQGQFEEAIRHYTEAIARESHLADAHFNLGLALSQLRQFKEAVAPFRRYVELEPKIGTGHFALATTLLEIGDTAEAIVEYRIGLALQSDSWDAHFNLAVALARSGQGKEAIAEYQEAIRLQPNSWEAHYQLGGMLLEEGRVEEAIAAYEKAAALNPQQSEAYSGLGSALVEDGQLDRAVEAFGLVLRSKPNDAAAIRDRAWVFWRKRDYSSAVQDLDRAVQLDPGHVFAFLVRGWSKFCLGLFAPAIEDFRQAMESGPEDTYTAYAALAAYLAQERLGQSGLGDLKERASKLNLLTWPGPVINLYLGEAAQDPVLAAAHDEDPKKNRTRLCEAYYFFGQRELLRGNEGQAGAWFGKAVNTKATRTIEFTAAEAELILLSGKARRTGAS